jgi:hypothetical protein
MKNMGRIGQRFLLLAVLLFGLGFVFFTNLGVNKTQASLACCYDCLEAAAEEECLDEAGFPNHKCSTGTLFCWHHCSFSSCAPGSCISSDECPTSNCVCTGYRCVCP